MPFPIEIPLLLQKSEKHLQDGRSVEAQGVILQAESELRAILGALTSQEEMILSAAIAFQLKRCQNYQKAAMLLERVCDLAIQLDPDSPQTFGDFCELAECYLNLNQPTEALSVYKKARPVCTRACPERLSILDQKITTLSEKCISEKSVVPIEIICKCPAINYSIVHSGLPIFETLIVKNVSDAHTLKLALQVNVPGHSAPTRVPEFALAPGEQNELASQVKLHFVQDRLARQSERARAVVEITSNAQVVHSEEVWILAYNECSNNPYHAAALASFVHPNNPAIRMLAKQMSVRIKEKTGWVSFLEARESQDPNRIDAIGRALYDCLKEEYVLKYDYEPPSWESYSQRVRFPDEVMVSGTGTCLDFMFLLAAALENVLVGSPSQPVLLIVSGEMQHALIGCWRKQPNSQLIVTLQQKQVLNWLDSGLLWIMDTTGFSHGNPFWEGPVAYEECVKKGVELIKKAQRILAVDLSAARPDYISGRPGITPLPFRCEPPYGESALQVLWSTRQAWHEAPTPQIQSTHLLRGLLHRPQSVAEQFFDQLSYTTYNPLIASAALDAFLATGLKQVKQRITSEPKESDGYVLAKNMAAQEAQRLNALMVEDLHLLFAILRHPGLSVEKAFKQRRTSSSECLAFLERLNPAPSPSTRSQFPSEVNELI